MFPYHIMCGYKILKGQLLCQRVFCFHASCLNTTRVLQPNPALESFAALPTTLPTRKLGSKCSKPLRASFREKAKLKQFINVWICGYKFTYLYYIYMCVTRYIDKWIYLVCDCMCALVLGGAGRSKNSRSWGWWTNGYKSLTTLQYI